MQLAETLTALDARSPLVTIVVDYAALLLLILVNHFCKVLVQRNQVLFMHFFSGALRSDVLGCASGAT